MSQAGWRGGVVVRAPNHLGDLIMALPALALAGGDVVVVRWLAPLLDMARRADPTLGIGEVLPLDRGAAGTVRGAAALRGRRYGTGVLLTPSFSSALLFALGGVRRRRGAPTDGRRALLTDPVRPSGTERPHRAAEYVRLVTGDTVAEPPPIRLPVPDEDRARWSLRVERGGGELIGVFPGSNAASRRWEPRRFAELVRRLAGQGAKVVVFGSAAERDLAAEVAGGVALNLAGETDLPLLAAGLAACRLLVTNDSGPMHLAAAVGTPTVSFWGPGDPRVTRPLGGAHTLLRDPTLPCVPCVKNHCPRRGAGYRLPDARRECLQLIEVEAAEDAVSRRLRGVTT